VTLESNNNEFGVFERLEKFFRADKMYWRLLTNVLCHNYYKSSCIVPSGPLRDLRVEPTDQKGSEDSNEANCTNAEVLE